MRTLVVVSTIRILHRHSEEVVVAHGRLVFLCTDHDGTQVNVQLESRKQNHRDILINLS